MKELKLLLRVNALNVFNFNRLRYTADRKERAKALWAFIGFTFVGLLMAGQMGTYSYMLAFALTSMDALSIMPGYIMMSASLVILVTTVYKSVGTLFSFRDYDAVMALPFKTSTVVMSRILMLYGSNLFFSAFIMIPAGIVYAYFAQPPFAFYPVFLVCYLAMPVLPSVLACLLGLFIAAVSARFKYKNIASVLAGLALVAAAVVLSVSLPEAAAEDPSKVLSVVASISDIMSRTYPPSVWFTKALQLDISYLLLYLSVSAAVFVLLSLGIGATFKRINTALSGIRTSAGYRIGELKTESPLRALYKKEITRYFASALYVTNTAVGVLLLLLAAGALFIMGPEKVMVFLPVPGFWDNMPQYAPFIISVFVSLSVTTSASISIEGKHIWVLKALPVRAADIFRAKALVNLTLAVPGILIGSTLTALALKTSLLQTVLLYLTPLAYSLLTTYLGITVNLAFPKFDWTSETQIIKQGTAMMISVFGNMALAAVPILVILNISLDPSVLTVVWTAVLFIAYRLVLAGLRTKGERRLLALNA
ncbi:MAG: hypothetical protein BWY11_01110 [Firmicutes bacterium ADurb.Bin182]|nr:MAG: hypothetical protein BWY11_01110 [Firmicutes bacterium ADurb.Bin182]